MEFQRHAYIAYSDFKAENLLTASHDRMITIIEIGLSQKHDVGIYSSYVPNTFSLKAGAQTGAGG